MSDRSFDTDRMLPCGRTVAMLVSFVADRAPAELADHVETCQFCSAEFVELEHSWGLVRRSASVPVQPPDGLIERTLGTVRRLRGGHGAGTKEFAQDRGSLRIAAHVVLALSRQACSDILTTYPGVTLRSCSGGSDEVRVDLVVGYPLAARELAVSVQAELARALDALLGVAAPLVSAQVVDVDPPID